MTLLQALGKINYFLRGLDDDAPTVGSDEANYWVSLLNSKKDELYQDVGKTWSFIYKDQAPNEPGTVATSATTALTGTNTNFTDYRIGDQIVVEGETVRTIATITSDTALTVTVAFSNTDSGLTFTRKTIVDDGVQTYSVHRRLLAPSDRVYVLDTTANKIGLDLIHPQERDYVSQQVHLSGGNPEILTFTEAIEATDQMVGGTLVIPGYYLPSDVSVETEQLPVPDPNWLVMAVASEIAFADITYEDRAETLNTKANALWRAMVMANRRGVYGQPRKTPYNVKRIRDTRER